MRTDISAHGDDESSLGVHDLFAAVVPGVDERVDERIAAEDRVVIASPTWCASPSMSCSASRTGPTPKRRRALTDLSYSSIVALNLSSSGGLPVAKRSSRFRRITVR
jgi:hypothetical protein